ncbi:MAG: septum site-determining protein MinC [Anaerolineales bacterium]|nr:septum site-determining protein MinC [Anaerolineales bacterium]
MQDSIELKGIREGLLVTVDPNPDWVSIMAQITTRIDNQAAFFKGARMVLQLGERAVQRPDLAKLGDMLHERSVELVCVLSNSATTQGATRQLGFVTDLTEIQPQHRSVKTDVEQPPHFQERILSDDLRGSEGVLIRRTLRGGHTIQTPGHVVIIGDVNPGAEIVAGGDIVVWGRLMGVVHAGAMGDDTSVVCALDLQPTQLRISTLITVSPSGKRRKPRPERAFIQDGQIKAEAWK